MDTPDGSFTPPPPPPPVPTGGAPSGGDLVYPQQPPKDPILILILNLLLFGCVGYFIIGQKMKAIVALVIFIVGIPFTCGILSTLSCIAAAVDGYLQAQQLQAGHPVAQWTFFNDHR
jgi:TM2 domain-containing membrane protein YozV